MIEWTDGMPDGSTRDLNTPELTGRRRYLNVPMAGNNWLVLQVEEAVYTEVSGKRGWEIRWRFAQPGDVMEDVV